ncbi:MAG TPA: HutD family protein [Clostridia bacterium]|nr:HutD family protein [Clostridia bacterium]
MFQKITTNLYKTSKWAGGTTTELFIWPIGAAYENRDFLWRLSTAKVEQQESDFTKLTEYERVIIPLSGDLELKHGEQPYFTLKQLQAHRFDGAWDTRSRGCIRDFNLMIKKGSCRGDAEAIVLKPNESSSLYCDSEDLMHRDKFLYCFDGEVYLYFDRQSLSLAQKESIFLQGVSGEIRIQPQNGMPATIVSVKITCKA